MIRALTAGLTAAVLLTSAPAAGLAASPAPRSLVLKVSDLPAGFVKTQGRDLPNAEMIKQRVLSAAGVRSFSRLLGYGENFRRAGATGLLMVQSEVVQFGQIAGAHRYYLRIVRNNQTNARRQPKFHLLHTTRVGDESTTFSYGLAGGGGGVITGLVSHRGKYLSDTLTFSAGSQYRPERIIDLGKIVDVRIRSAK